MGMDEERFYESPSSASLVKQVIVVKYFGAWKNVLKTWGSRVLGYMDLYSGPGRYNDDSFSTPLLVLQEALKDSYLCDHLATVFNDYNPELAERLRANINGLPGIERLKHKPIVHALSVSPELARLRPAGPTLLFADPWGYKGLSLEMIGNFLGVPGSDCIFFFNYNRINAGLNWKGFNEPLDGVFGSRRAVSLRTRLTSTLAPAARQEVIFAELELALKEAGAHCVPRFTFSFPESDKVSHHLLFVSKSEKGCSIMKNVMRKQSSVIEQGIANFAHGGPSPSDSLQALLPGFGPLDQLKGDLREKFSGRTLQFGQLLAEHQHPTAVEANYRDAVLQLESEDAVTVTVVGRQRRRKGDKLTVPDDAVLTFK